VIEVDGQGKGLGLKCAVELDVIDQFRDPSKTRPQRCSLQLAGTLNAPEGVGTSVSISSGANTSSALSTASEKAQAWLEPSMIRTTAEASSTRRDDSLSAISTLPILADWIFRGWIKRLDSLLLGQHRQLHEGLSPPLTGITTTGLLQGAESLLAQAAPVAPGPELQDLVQRIGEIADLQGCHGRSRSGLLSVNEFYMR
jgi:hypothetical protein